MHMSCDVSSHAMLPVLFHCRILHFACTRKSKFSMQTVVNDQRKMSN
jgi:hypothetical protein